MTPDQLLGDTVQKYSDHINPYLAKLMNFAGFGVETRAEGSYLYDQDGKQYIDFLGGYGVFGLGHRHPKVIEAVKAQLDLIPLAGKTFFNRPQAELAAKLAAIAPDGLEYSFFSNSGAEAVEAALKFAKATTKRSKIVSTEGAYHGKTVGSLSATGREKYRKPFEPLMPGVVIIPFGDLSAVEAMVDDDTACFIVEPIQGEGGVIVPEPGYLSGIRKICDRHGALLIADEVQTGLGRTGMMFGCNHDGVSPDIMTLAKALGGGVMPIGATLFTRKVCDGVFSENPLAHSSTFGGGELACVAGLATLQVLEEEGLVEQSRTSGEYLIGKLTELCHKHDLIATVRGKGLIIGVEFALDEVGELVIGQMVKRGMVAAYTLNNKRVIRMEPALNIKRDLIDQAVQIFDESVEETAEILASIA